MIYCMSRREIRSTTTPVTLQRYPDNSRLRFSPCAIFWLERLHNILQTDFIEYNARPYQGYTMAAIQNLYSFAKDSDPVKRAAEMVLNYVSAKLADSANDNRRAVPYRRKKEYNDPNLLGVRDDPQ